MRGIRLTAAERSALEWAFENAGTYDPSPLPKHYERSKQTILRKLKAADEPKGIDPVPIERALMESAPNKLVALAGSGYARAAIQAKAVDATEETARIVGRWLSHQKWLGKTTLLVVLSKWPEWYPLALDWARPGNKPKAGLNGSKAENVGPSPGGTGQATETRRPAQGFR